MGLCVLLRKINPSTTRLKKRQSHEILVFGAAQEEHDEALEALLHRLVKLNLTVGEEKCEFNKEEITFYGMVISKNGIKP